MAKVKISEFSANPASNTDIDGINIAENCPPSGINDAIRELMAQLKDFQAGTAGDSFNGPIGTTTAAAGAFTTLSASGAVTLSGGTANGVAYLNGSKVLTTGSALVFDGANLGIGTSSPGARVDAQSSTSTEVRSTATSAGGAGNYAGFRAVNGGGSAAIFGSGTTAGSFSYTGELANAAFVGSFGNNPLQLVTNSVARATLDSSGNLGLGVTPSAWGSSVRAFESLSGTSLYNTGTGPNMFLGANHFYNGSNFIYKTTSVASVYSQVSGVHSWYTAPSGTAGNAISFTQAMSLTAAGELLVGTTSALVAGLGMRMVVDTGSSSDGIGVIVNPSGTPQAMRFAYGSTAVGSIILSPSATSYNTSSDYRLKENIAPMTGALAKVAALKPVTYTWKADGSAGEGFIAHELAEVCPAAVTGEKDAVDADGKPQYQGIDVSFLVGTLTAAIQELKAEFDAYKASHP